MNVLLIKGFCNGRPGLKPCLLRLLGLGLALAVAGAGIGLWTGYQWGAAERELSARTELAVELEHQQRALAAIRERSQAHLDALTLKLGHMEARLMRLDALGERLTEMGKLDTEEFRFDEVPARGGLEARESARSVDAAELLAEIEGLSRRIDDRALKLGLMEDLLLSWNLSDEVRPEGRPVEGGWLSSEFGPRKDPFTGKEAFHHGLDFAGKRGSEVVAVAAGVVTWAGDRGGYGGLVEIDHGDGYVTRYGHNERIRVEPGDTVAKGQTIAHMGSSGRSTGPHVHFELLKDGRQVDPAKYLASR